MQEALHSASSNMS